MILMEFTMQLTQAAMIGAVLTAAVKAFVVGPFVRACDAAMHTAVLGMITRMALGCVIIFVSERRGYRNGEEERGGRQKKFSRDHRYILSLEAVGDLTDYLYNLTLAAWA